MTASTHVINRARARFAIITIITSITPLASAQSRTRPATARPVADAVGPRFRVGAGLHGGYARYGAGASAAFLIAGFMRVGAQLNDLWALEAQLSGGWLATMYYVRANAYADVTLASRVSFAIGPVWSQGAFGEGSGSMLGASARITAFPVSERLDHGVRFGLAISLEADLGASLTESCYCAPPFLPRGGSVSWGLYGGIGFIRF